MQRHRGTDSEERQPLLSVVRDGVTRQAPCPSLQNLCTFKLQAAVCCNCLTVDCKCIRSCRKTYRRYFFVSKALYLVLLLNILFSAALYGVTSEVLKIIIGPEFVLARNLVIHGVTRVLFPVAGHVADTYVGRHNVIRFSLWIAWVGFAVMSVSFSTDRLDDHINATNRFVILPISFTLLSISYVCFMSNIILFGMDQLQGASHVHYCSFFCWWYWTLNVGVIVVNLSQYCTDKVEMSVTIQAGIGIFCVSAAIILDALLKHWFVIEPCSTNGNPLQQIAKILRHIATSPKTQRVPSAVRHELDMGHLSRLDLAKLRYGGKYATEEVEDVKTFFRMVVLLCSVGFPVFSYAGVSKIHLSSYIIHTASICILLLQVFGTMGLLVAHMNNTIASIDFQTALCGVEFTLTDGISAILLLTFIPFLDLLAVPFLRHRNPSILKRLGIGATLAFLSMLTVFLMEGIGKHTPGDRVCMFNTEEPGKLEVNAHWVVLPLAIVTLAEIYIYIPSKHFPFSNGITIRENYIYSLMFNYDALPPIGFEFICAQAPYNMRGLLVGLFFSIQGLFSLISILLQYTFSQHAVYSYPFQGKTGLSCGFWYYFILVLISFLGLLLYFLAAHTYKQRQRDNRFDTTITMLEGYFESGAVGIVNSDTWAV